MHERPAVTCTSCGAENRVGRKFCGECGASLAAACPACGTPNEADERFCGECGTRLDGTGHGAGRGAGAPTPQPAAGPRAAGPGMPAGQGPTAELRLVSVLFADLVGFTTLAEGRDAEDTRELLSRYFDLAQDVVGRYGGTIEKFIGDAVMAVWGTPVVREDDAELAVRAALELVDAIHALGPGLSARAGVLTGEAAVTLGATNQGMVAGDLVNTASRLQSVAPPGTVLVGEPTRRAAAKAIAFEEAGDQLLKGKTAPVPAFRALRVVAEVGGRGRHGDTLEAPFVGRDEELRLVKELFHATARERRTRLVSITGIAGIGKSRLAWEFEKYIDGLIDVVWWHRGRSPAYGEGITFWAVGEMVRTRCGLVETDDEATTRSKVAATVRDVVLDEAERRWIESAILSLLGLGGTIAADQLFAAWRTFFERLSATGPVVLVFEDVHWADPGTLDFVDHLLEWSRGTALYLVTLARPELLERRPDWGAGRRSFTSLYLEPLRETAMRDLLGGLVPGLPEPAVAAVVARADGVPLYAVETVRMLLADGRLEPRGDGSYEPKGDLTELAVPETLTAVIAARLDGLDPVDRSLVLDAAVLGQSFTVAGLSAVSGMDPEELEARLRGLVRRELLGHETDPMSPERGQYAFVQALIREVAYNTLAKRDRKVRHLAAARFFEGLGNDELAAALAGHYLAARENAGEGAEADALAAQARIALSAAAERAAGLAAHEQALGLLRQALTVATEPADEAGLLERAGAAATTIQRYDEAQAMLSRAVELRRSLGDRPGEARALALLGRELLGANRIQDAQDLVAAACEAFADLPTDPAVIELQVLHARTYGRQLDWARALELLEAPLEAAEHADHVAVLADGLVIKGAALGGRGRLHEGIGLTEVAERLARRHGLSTTLIRALSTRSTLQLEVDVATAAEALEEGLALARRRGEQMLASNFSVNLGWYGYLGGAWDTAVATFASALADETEPSMRAALLANLTSLRACRGEDVSAALDELEAMTAGSNDVDAVGQAADARGHAAFAAGRMDEAIAHWLEVTRLLASGDTSTFAFAARAALWARDRQAAQAQLDAHLASGLHGNVADLRRKVTETGLLALEGRVGEALAGYREAFADYADIGLRWEQALTGLDAALLLDPSDSEVAKLATAARAILVELGARPFIAHLDARLGDAIAASTRTAGM